MNDQVTDMVERDRVAAICGVSPTVVAVSRLLTGVESVPARYKFTQAAARLVADRGEVTDASELTDENFEAHSNVMRRHEAPEMPDVVDWPDFQLIAAVRRDPPHQAALDALVDRYWKPLFGRCQMLALNHQRASDLAQEAWCRVLRARHSLKPDGNFRAYLSTVATNLWRDWHRSARRAGPLGERRLSSLDAALPGGEGETVFLKDVVPDLDSLEAEKCRLLRLDIDLALDRLAPQLREV